MDGIFGKFGLYDFMGIWGPGAIMLTYYLFTLYDKIKGYIDGLDIVFPAFDQLYGFILLYTAAAYILGVILHEAGRIILDAMRFGFVKVKSIVDKKPEISKKLKIFLTWIGSHCFEEEQRDSVGISFEEARSYLRFSGGIDTRRMDTYHSVYALSRSLSVGVFAHLVLAVCFVGSSELLRRLIIIDCALLALFVIRAFRYRRYWIKYTFVQYELVQKKQGETVR